MAVEQATGSGRKIGTIELASSSRVSLRALSADKGLGEQNRTGLATISLVRAPASLGNVQFTPGGRLFQFQFQF